MTSKERFRAVCEFRLPDRFPMDYLAAPATDARLCEYYDVATQDDLLDVLGIDFYYLSFRDISQNESSLPFYHGPELEMNDQERVCPFGIRWTRGAYASKFAVDEALRGPLEKATCPGDILRHCWPSIDDFEITPLHQECERHWDKVLVGGCWTGILGDSYRMMGFENFLLALAHNPELVGTLVGRMTDFYLKLNDKVFREIGDKLDIWSWGNDFGSQNGLLFSPDMFAELFLPHIRALNELAHSYRLKVMMHSCGAIAPLIPQLIEAGVDILDPIQVTAAGMDPNSLKQQFGDRIVFHGAVDTQRVLPIDDVEGVYRHVQDTLGILGRNGGYIFAPSQILQEDIPVKNIDAMYRAARDFCPQQSFECSNIHPEKSC